MNIEKDKLPTELSEIIEKIVSIFETNNIDYWLGGGLYQLILENRYSDITENWQKHDLDFHIWHKDKGKVFQVFSEVSDFDDLAIYEPNKIAFKYKNHAIEMPWLFKPSYAPNTVFFLSWGKKEKWPLNQIERQLFYHFSLPLSLFREYNFLDFPCFNVRVPKREYIDLLYK